MYRKILILLIVLVAVAAVSCKNKEKSKFPDGKEKVTEYAPIPSFKVLLLALNQTESSETVIITVEDITAAQQDTLHLAFLWGTLTADAQLSILGQRAEQMSKILDQMVDLAPKLAWGDIGSKLRDGVKPMLKKKDWAMLETSIYSMQSLLEQKLFSQKNFETYTMVKLGEWTEATYRLAELIAQDSTTHQASIILNPQAWQGLKQNLDLIKTKQYTSSPGFKNTVDNVAKIETLMSSPELKTLTPQQVKQVLDLTANIRTTLCKQP